MNSRNKGHGFERTVARDLQKNGFPEARRHLEYQKSEAHGIDIDNVGPFAVQCKNKKRQPQLADVFDEIKTETKTPVVIFKVTGRGTFAAFRYEDALNLMRLFADQLANKK